MLPFISRRDINWPNLNICACSALKSKTNNSIWVLCFAESGDSETLFMEWNEETMLLVCEEILPRSSRQSDSLILQLHRHMIYPHQLRMYLQTTHFLSHYPMKTAVDCEAGTLLAPISTSKPQKIVGTVGMTQNYVSEQGESESFCWCTTPCGCLLFTVCFPGC